MDLIAKLQAFFLTQPPALLWGLGAIGGLLVLGSLVAAVLTVARPKEDYRELRQRMSSWWVMIGLLAGAQAPWRPCARLAKKAQPPISRKPKAT